MQLAWRTAADGHEARAKTLEAREILVAAGLVDTAFASQLGFERLDRDAVRLLRAVAASLTDRIVDEDARGRIRIQTALASPPFLRGTGLIIDQHSEPRQLAQFPLHRVELVPMAYICSARQDVHRAVFLRLFRDDHDALGALPCDLMCDLHNAQVAFDGLTARHGDCIVEENLVGDVDARSGGRADCGEAAMRVGPIPEILEHMFFGGERRLPDPVGSFPAHLRERRGVSVWHEQRHGMATDAGHGAAALRQASRRAVRASRAEKRSAPHGGEGRLRHPAFQVLQPCKALLERRGLVSQATQPRHDDPRHYGRRELACARQERCTAFIGFSEDHRPARGIHIEQKLHELLLDKAALFLDHQNLFQTVGEAPRSCGLEGPGETDLVEAYAERGCGRIVDTKLVQCLTHIEVGLARCYDTQARAGRIDGCVVERIRPRKCTHGFHFRTVQAALLIKRPIHRAGRPADMQPAGRHLEILRRGCPDPLGINMHGCRALDGLAQRFESNPTAAVARQRKPQNAEIEILLHGCRIENRHHCRCKNLLALMRGSRRLRAVIVACDGQHTAVDRGTSQVRVSEYVYRAINSGPLAIPDGEDAIDRRTWE